jgi:MFS family permease
VLGLMKSDTRSRKNTEEHTTRKGGFLMKNELMKKIAILSVSFIVVSGGAVAANIPAMAKTFADVPLSTVEMLSTIPALFIIVSVLVSNTIARYLGYKRTIAIGIAIVLVSGIIPAITNNFWIIFISRALFGIGIGLFNSLLIAIISHFYDGDERSAMIGFQSAFEGLGGMTATFAVGQLLKIHWQTSFWVYLSALPVLILFLLFVPNVTYDEIRKEKSLNTSVERVPNKKANNEAEVGKRAFLGYIVLLVIVVVIYMSIAVKVTTLMTTLGYGDATDSSNILALIGVGAMAAGFLFGKVYRVTKKYTLPLAFFFMSIGMLLIGSSNSIFQTGIGAIICGFSVRTFIPYLFNKINASTAGNAGYRTSLLLVGFNFGSAFSPYGIALLERVYPVSSVRDIFFIEAAMMVILALIGVVLATRKPVEDEQPLVAE